MKKASNPVARSWAMVSFVGPKVACVRNRAASAAVGSPLGSGGGAGGGVKLPVAVERANWPRISPLGYRAVWRLT